MITGGTRECTPVGTEQKGDGRRHLFGLDQALDGLRGEEDLF